jgi:hypothetical protein
MVLPMTAGSRFSDVLQKRWVSTTAGAASGPSSAAPSRRPRTGRSPITSKYEPLTTPARIVRGSPKPFIVKPMVEKSPKALIVVARETRSRISGIEKVVFSARRPGARWRM